MKNNVVLTITSLLTLLLLTLHFSQVGKPMAVWCVRR